MLYLQLSSDQQWDTSPKLATRVANAPFLFAGCSQGPRAVGGAFEKVTSSPLPRKEMPAASDGGGAEAQRGAKGVTAKCTPLVTGWPGPSSQGGAGHLRTHAREQLPDLLNCQGRRLGLRESSDLSKDKGHLSSHPKKGRSVSMTRESWQAQSCHWHPRGTTSGLPSPSPPPPHTHHHLVWGAPPTPGSRKHASPVSSHLISKRSCSALWIKAGA